MKKIIKAGQFIVFAVAIMGLFAACGESEVFDEPTVYQTRATRSMDAGAEAIVIKDSGEEEVEGEIYYEGRDTIAGQIVEKRVTATVVLKWHEGFERWESSAVSSELKRVDCGNTNFSLQFYSNEKEFIQDNLVYVRYNFTIANADTTIEKSVWFETSKKIETKEIPRE